MVERTMSGYHLSGDDAIEFCKRLHSPTKEEIDINASYFDKLENTVHIAWLNNGEFIAEISEI